MEAKSIRKILKKYLIGNAAKEEEQVVDNWFSSFEQEAPVSLTEQEKEMAKQEIWERIAPALVPAKVRVMPQWMKVAAWAAVVAGIVFTVVMITGRQSKQSAPAFTVISTNDGERSKVTISDGTQLSLNAGTTIHVYNDFSTERRIDLVDGEVFFDVKRDPQRPFHIHSGDLSVAVLGTSFNVSAYNGLDDISVGVVTGKVSVAMNNDTLGVLEKAQELVFDKELQTHVIGPLSESMLAWKEGRLVLNDLTFEEMTCLMKKNFGIEITTEDNKVKNTKYTTQLPTSLMAGEAVEVLAAIHHLTIKKVNGRYILSAK